MAVRSTMAALIARVRLLINDTGTTQQFSDQNIQDVMDESRRDLNNIALKPNPTYITSSIQYLDYYAEVGGWEDNYTLKQYLTIPVTASLNEPIPGHWQFAQNTLPPVYISGSNFDVYRSAADLLERLAARWSLSYNISVDGQSLQRAQVAPNLLALAKTYRMKQRPRAIDVRRADLIESGPSLAPTDIDYIASGDSR